MLCVRFGRAEELLMKRADLAIINRSFWPVYPVIGEALLQFAEKTAEKKKVCVILQDHADIHAKLAEHNRGEGISFYPCKAWTISSSGILHRIFDAVFFMFWVMFALLWSRPKQVYVATDPPVLIPFIVMLYSKIFNAKYIYHLQDIHPEASHVVIPVNKIIYRLSYWIDCLVMRQAFRLITITKEMKQEIESRSATKSPIYIISNPSVSFNNVIMPIEKKQGFSFCGNAGRLQRIPLLIEAITNYCDKGGKLPFIFAGEGVYAEALKELSERFDNVSYLGLISAGEAAQVNADYQWALLPIENEVTRFAFPSKSSSYVFSGAFLAAICDEQTSVASWIKDNNLGLVIDPTAVGLCEFFINIENESIDLSYLDTERWRLKEELGFEVFMRKIQGVIFTDDAG